MSDSISFSDLERILIELDRWHAHVRRMKRENFHATETIRKADNPWPPQARSDNGYNTVADRPDMGKAGARFARNLPLDRIEAQTPDRQRPDPREVSAKLLSRGGKGFAPARQVNMLAAAWIQFQVHDWFGHRESSGPPLALDARDGHEALSVAATEEEHYGTPKLSHPPVYANKLTHWWDGSQIYGSDAGRSDALRVKDGDVLRAELELVMHDATGDVLLPLEQPTDARARAGFTSKPMTQDVAPGTRTPGAEADARREQTGFSDNWWAGLSLLHTLFAREHNAICAALRAGEPELRKGGRETEQRVFETARLVNTALMAKIHTVEWTPAMLADEPIRIALYADWWGIPDDKLLDASRLLAEGFAQLQHLSAGQALRALMTSEEEPFAGLRNALAAVLLRPARPDSGETRGGSENGRRASSGHTHRPRGARAAEVVEAFLTGLAGMIAGSPPDRMTHPVRDDLQTDFPDGAVYAMTEEFVSIYRMHPLFPDRQPILPIGTDPGRDAAAHAIDVVEAKNLLDRGARALIEEHGLATVCYSLGNTHPGSLTLGNYPEVLIRLDNEAVRENDAISQPLDLAAVDILRDRERGVPRYTRFRHWIRGDRVVTFEDLTGARDPSLDPSERERREKDAASLREVYGNVDDVDLMVGLFAEAPREGFAFSETAFYVFALMAPLRLRADPFFTDYYDEAHYTVTGLDWINGNTMTTVLSRHLGGELRGALANVGNAFEPWRPVPDAQR